MTDEKKNAFTKDTIFSVTPAHLSKVNKITQAPPPITPVGDGEYNTFHAIADSIQRPLGPIVPITGIELMERWSIEATTLILLSYEGMLFPSFPADFRNDVNWLMVQNSKTQESFLSKCIYDKDIIEVAEIVYSEHLTKLSKKEALEDDQEITLTPTPAPQTIPLSDIEAEEFIKSMAISYLSNTEVIIKVGSKVVTASRKDMGFKANSKPWAMFIKMLQDPKKEYNVGIYDKNKNPTNIKNYNASMQLFPNFSEKFVAFINNQFSMTLPIGFNVFKNMKGLERAGTYNAKFNIFKHRECKLQTDVTGLSKEDTINKLSALCEQRNHEKDETERERLLDEIGNLAQHAKNRNWITLRQLSSLLSLPDNAPSNTDVMSIAEEFTEKDKLSEEELSEEEKQTI
jgi:hypothetical protein